MYVFIYILYTSNSGILDIYALNFGMYYNPNSCSLWYIGDFTTHAVI